MILTANWQPVATRPAKAAEWHWLIDALERVAFASGRQKGLVETRLRDQSSEGHEALEARDRLAAALERKAAQIARARALNEAAPEQPWAADVDVEAPAASVGPDPQTAETIPEPAPDPFARRVRLAILRPPSRPS